MILLLKFRMYSAISSSTDGIPAPFGVRYSILAIAEYMLLKFRMYSVIAPSADGIPAPFGVRYSILATTEYMLLKFPMYSVIVSSLPRTLPALILLEKCVRSLLIL